MNTSYRPTPYADIHVGGLWAAWLNWRVARKTGGEFVYIADDINTEMQQTWVQGFPVEVAVQRNLEDLQWCGLEPDRVEWSSRNRERHDWAARKIGLKPLEEEFWHTAWLSRTMARPLAWDFNDAPSVGCELAPETEIVALNPHYMIACLVDDIDFGIGGWVAGKDQEQLLYWCEQMYGWLGYPPLQMWFAPLVKRSRKRSKESKSDPNTIRIRQLREAGYAPHQLLSTLKELTFVSHRDGLESLTIPQGVLEPEEVRWLSYRNRRNEELASGEFPIGTALPEMREHIAARAKASCQS